MKKRKKKKTAILSFLVFSIILIYSNAMSQTFLGRIELNGQVFPIGFSYNPVTPDGSRALIPAYRLPRYLLIAIDTANNSIAGEIEICGRPGDIEISPDGTKLYLSNFQCNSVTIIDIPSLSVDNIVEVGEYPLGINLTADGRRLYVANRDSMNISVIDTLSNRVINTIPNPGFNPYDVFVTRDEQFAFISGDPRQRHISELRIQYVGIRLVNLYENRILWDENNCGFSYLYGSPDRNHLASWGCLWEVENQRRIGITFATAIFSPDSRYLFGWNPGSSIVEIRVREQNWNTEAVIGANAQSVFVSQDGNVVFAAGGGSDGAITAWDLSNFELIWSIDRRNLNFFEIHDYLQGVQTVFSIPPDGRKFVVVAGDSILFFDRESGLQPSTPTTNQPPTASASASITVGTAPLTVSFTGRGSDPDGSISSYNWDFGDGASSSEQNPQHTYLNPGTYTATLTVTDNMGATATSTIQIIVSAPTPTTNRLPVATASANPSSGRAPLSVQFLVSASDPDGSIASYQWDFGDGTTSTDQNPQHVYPTPGTYLATVTVRDNLGGLGSSTVSIRVEGGSNLVSIAISPSEVLLTERSGGVRLTAIGNFSDGTTQNITSSVEWSTSNASVVQVSASGLATAIGSGVAIVTASVGSVSGMGIITVRLPTNIPPTASASAAPVTGTAPLSVQFTGSGADADGIISSYRWDFGDGSEPSSQRNPTHIYREPGTYIATFTVTDDLGAAAQQEITISAQEALLVSLTMSSANVRLGEPGALAQLTVLARYSDGRQEDVTGRATFASSDERVALVSASGSVVARTDGQATITASYGGLSSTAEVIVATDIEVTGTIRIRPQLLAAGFDPTIVDTNDDSFEIIAMVRPGGAPIRTVTISQNYGQFSLSMGHSYTLSNGDQLWRSTFNFVRGAFGETTFRALWGDSPGEFNVTVIDEAQQRHSFPDLEFGNTPAPPTGVTSPIAPSEMPLGIHRARPQVLAAGFSPTIIDLSDDRFDVIAIVRRSAMPIRAVTITQNQGDFSFGMEREVELDNGDELWLATFNYLRGSFGAQTLRAIWGERPGEFNITVIDQAQQQHSFPNLEFGNNPPIR